jgi:hypothetical protein
MERLFPYQLAYRLLLPFLSDRLFTDLSVTSCHVNFQHLILWGLSGKPDTILYGFPGKKLNANDSLETFYIFMLLSIPECCANNLRQEAIRSYEK